MVATTRRRSSRAELSRRSRGRGPGDVSAQAGLLSHRRPRIYSSEQHARGPGGAASRADEAPSPERGQREPNPVYPEGPDEHRDAVTSERSDHLHAKRAAPQAVRVAELELVPDIAPLVVCDERTGLVGAAMPGGQKAPEDVRVLARAERRTRTQSLVEAADREDGVTTHGHVRSMADPLRVANPFEPSRPLVREHRTAVLGAIPGGHTPGYEGERRIVEAMPEPLQPGRVRDAVVVGECDQVCSAVAKTGVARSRQAGAIDAKTGDAGRRRDVGGGRSVGRRIDDHDRVVRGKRRSDRGQRGRELP